MENNNIEYGPAKKVDQIDNCKKALTEKVESLTLKQLYKLQRKMAFTVSGLEEISNDEKKKEKIQKMITELIAVSNEKELDDINDVLDNIEPNL